MKLFAYVLSLLCFIPTLSAQELTRITKIQGVATSGVFDRNMLSPKSALFSVDGKSLYINALEAGKTLVYDFPSLKQKAVIDHTFNASNASLFMGQSTVFNYPLAREQVGRDVNTFTGKPVEMALSHNGRYLWVPYYRRSNDPRAAGPSAVAVIDTASNRIVRVLPTGPLPKYVAVSPDSRSVLVVHWGDNTLIKFDTSSSDIKQWSAQQHWVVERQMDVRNIGGDRDKNCGFCLRGTVFSRDGQTVLVSRMGGGGIAGFDTSNGRYLGTVTNVAPTPRHLAVSKDGETLWATSNVSGIFSAFPMDALVESLRNANGKRVIGPASRQLHVGSGARTVSISPNEHFAYIATNTSQRIAAVDLKTWKMADTVAATPFPVGLAVSPDGCYVVSTSQGRAGQGGGNTVDVFRSATCSQ